MAPNFGLNTTEQKQEKEVEEQPRRLSSQVVPVHRYNRARDMLDERRPERLISELR
jgi:hypothetical protein